MADGWVATSEPVPMLIARIDDDACDRLVAVFDEPGGYAVPLDADRPINRDLLEAREVVLVHDDQTILCRVSGHAIADETLIRRLSDRVGCHISDETTVLHLVPETDPGDPFLVVALDGSERSGAALAAARELAEWFGYQLRIAAIVDPDDPSSRDLVHNQLVEADLADHEWVASDRVVEWASAVAATGGVVVGAAFGHWPESSLAHGLVSALVEHDCASVVAVGPGVPDGWRPVAGDPIVVAVDASAHAAKVVDELQPLLHPPRSRLVVAHVAEPDGVVEDGADAASTIARRINERWGLPVRSELVAGTGLDRARAIADVAADEHAQIVVTHSWHRAAAGAPRRASVSVELAAHLHCPVIVLSSAPES